MKIILIAFLVTASANAASILSISECSVPLYRSNPWKKSYVLKDSRITGRKAMLKARELVRLGASGKVIKDELNVPRYQIVRSEEILERQGTSVNSCEGVYSAVKVEVCTVDSRLSVCETSCELGWKGVDCR